MIDRETYKLFGKILKDPAKACIMGVDIPADVLESLPQGFSDQENAIPPGTVMVIGEDGYCVPWDGTGNPTGLLLDYVYVEGDDDVRGNLVIAGWVNEAEIKVINNDVLEKAKHYLATHGFIGVTDPVEAVIPGS